ncbi:polyketide cyclase [Mycobacterium kyorinense]|uniref:Polyketide cyclase n=1 Tax=Mycobacterium kyorinense TaxID=487514 RepID=A0A1A2YXG5_9MYCO|nr:nuclear transport factor 2 family protein [Mycobacterium kyorinense]OBI42710.1 polyketide cyclase [Mycobacterium kyorinense]
MTPPVMQRWTEIVEAGRFDEIDELLADDAVFYSPAVFSPQKGRANTVAYLTAAGKLFANSDFRHVEQWYSDSSAILEFAANIDGVYVNGIDMVHWNDDEKIVSVKVMIRPFKALQAVIPRMAELLGYG